MTFPHLDKITGKLDRVKGQGLISDYLVSWRGRGGRLEPKVTVWRHAGATLFTLRYKLAASLLGLVPSGRIHIVDDHQRRD